MQADTQITASGQSTGARSWLRYAITIVALAFVVFSLFFRLNTYPAPWFDEGAYINVARTFAQDGVYAESSYDGYNFKGPTASTGPTVLLPIALAFKVFGPSITVARLVMAFYGILFFIALYLLGVQLADRRVAIAALILALLASGLNTMPYIFRNVIGEGAGIVLLLFGLWLWLRPGTNNVVTLVIVGVLIGLASITKPQFGLFILPGLLLSWFADLFWYKQRSWRFFIIPGIIAGVIYVAWHYYVLVLLGAETRNLAADMEQLGGVSTYYLFIDPPANVINLFKLTGGLMYVGFTIPAVLFGVIISRKRTEEAQRWGIVSTILILSSISYVFSVGWPRIYAPPLLIGSLFVARLLSELTNGFNLDWGSLRALISSSGEKKSLVSLVTLVAVGMSVIMIFLPILRVTADVVLGGGSEPYQVADYINQQASADAVVETWDKELSNLIDHPTHFPPQIVEAQVNAFRLNQGPPASELYDFREYSSADYVVIGPFSRVGEVYSSKVLAEDYTLVNTFGEYEIYEKHG